MSSIMPDYEYDIFISYRQKDNKADQWVTHFVEALRDEIEATFKEDISIYFDENPHDGLLETHDVDQSLKEKIKVLIFIPIVSQTYCDPNSFAWQHEFIAFRDFAKNDELGLDVRLDNGNVCKRILPVKIHEIDAEDQALYEKETGGVMRSIDFIYRASGVNRSLTPEDDKVQIKDQIFYRNQINKVANGIKEIINALQHRNAESDSNMEQSRVLNKSTPSISKISRRAISVTSFFVLLLALTAIWYFNIYDKPQVLSAESRNARVAIIPFTNNTNDPELDMLGEMAADWITKGLMNFGHIKVVSFETVRDNIDFALLKDSNMRAGFTERTGADKVIKGSFYQQGDEIVFQTQMIDIETGEVEFMLPSVSGEKSVLEGLVNELSQRVMTVFGLDSDENRKLIINDPPKYDAYKYYIKGIEYFINDYDKCREFLSEAIRLDSSFLLAHITMRYSFGEQGRIRESDSILVIINEKFKNPSPTEKEWLDFGNAKSSKDQYTATKAIYKRDHKAFLINYNMVLLSSYLNKPNEAVTACQNLNPKNISFKNPSIARIWFKLYSYNLIRLNRLDEALKVLEVVPPEFMSNLYYGKAMVFVLKNQPDKIHAMIQEMEDQGLGWNLIIRTYLNTSDWYALQGNITSQKKWAQLALDKINSQANGYKINQTNLPWAYYGVGNYEKALSLLHDITETKGRSSYYLSWIGLCYAKSDSIEQANGIISELDSLNTAGSKYGIAQVYSALNEKDLVVKYLQQAFKEDYVFYLGRYDTDFELLSLHGHPGYEELVKPKG
ncbi:MAG: hypothetical protein ABFS32_13100 [Bacteroidota bacterium]